MLAKTIRINLLFTLALVLSACAQNQAVDSNPQATSKQVSQADIDAAAEKMLEKYNFEPIFKEVLTSEQILKYYDREANLNLTDEQVKKLEEAGIVYLEHVPPELKKTLSPEQMEAIKRGNNPKLTDEQKAIEERAYEMERIKEEEAHPMPKLIKPGTDAPGFELTDNHGKKRKLSDFRGKYVLIDFWGTWCPPCIEALPKLAKAYKEMDKSKIEFIGLCTGGDRDNFVEFVEKEKLSWVQLHDPQGDVSMDYGVSAFPTLLLIGPDGKTIQSAEGFGAEGDLFATIKKLTSK